MKGNCLNLIIKANIVSYSYGYICYHVRLKQME